MKKILAALSIAVTTAVIAPSAASAVGVEGEWTSLGSGLGPAIQENVYDVVEGPDGNVYVTGCFDNAGGVAEADVIAMWDGTQWSALGDNGNEDGFFADGCGFSIAWNSAGDLILGGSGLRDHDDSSSQSLFSWDGTSWTNLAAGQIGGDGIRDIAIDSTDAIYFGGPFTNANSVDEYDFVAKLSGGVISGLGDDGSGGRPIDGHVMTVEIDESDNVFVAGKFHDAGGVAEADAVAKWNGTTWAALDSNGAGDGYFTGGGNDVINDLLYVNGDLYMAVNNWAAPEGADEPGVYVFDGTDITRVLGAGAFNEHVRSLDYDSDHNALLVAGWFDDFDDIPLADGVFSYDLDDSTVETFGEFESDGADPSGDGFSVAYLGGGDIAYGGWFNDLEGDPLTENFGIWDSSTSTWDAAGPRPDGAIPNNVYDVAQGPDGNYYATGCFDNAGLVGEADRVAMWDGESWVALGDNGAGDGFFDSGCGWALDWTSEGNLILGGRQLRTDTDNSNQSLFEWDGTTWTNLAPNQLTDSDGVRDVVVNEDDSIYIAGPLTDIDGDPIIDYVAKWTNGVFSALDDDGNGGAALNDHALNLELDDDGNLYVSGKFTNAGGVAEADLIAQWDGSAWSALDSNGSGDGYFSGSQIHAMKWHDGTLYLGANDVTVPDHSGIYGVFAYTDAAISSVIDPELINDEVRDLDYDASENRLLVAGWFENVDGDQLADGIISIDLSTSDIYTLGGATYPGDNADDGFDRYSRAHAIAYVGNGDVLYGGDFRDGDANPLMDYIALWNGPGVDPEESDGGSLAATGINDSVLVTFAVAATIAVAGGIGLRRRRI